eukprot:CCRYP_013825-RA/>CCRYP_013825-RA protein AED:0.46 eAED:0.17 QI:0/0/0/0.57/1/1/7/0/869
MQRASKNFGGDYIGYGAQTIKTILEHLRTEWCVVTTLEKKQASAAFHVQWDLTSHITKFARELDKQQKLCETSAYHPDATKVQYYVEGMYSSDMFDDKEMQAWELKPSARQSVGLAKTRRHPVQEQGKVQCRAHSFAPAEHAAALTTTQDHRLKQLETQQQELLSQTTKFMALLTAQQSIPTPGTTTGGQQRTACRNTRSTTAKSPHYCNSCKKSNVYHEGDACFALERTRTKRPQWNHHRSHNPSTAPPQCRPPANTVDIVPNLHQTLLSGSKFAGADYTAVYDKHEVNFYDSATINITRARSPHWLSMPTHRPLANSTPSVTVNDNTDTLILDSKCGLQSTQPDIIIEQSIRYLHAAAGFPTKSTWLAAIRKGNYSTWPLITVKNVHKHFPQSEETQQGHMRNQRQGTRSTKQALPQAEPRTPLPQLHDIFIGPMTPTAPFTQIKLNKTEGELILARNRALQRMKACGIQPTRQQKKLSKPGRTTSLPSSVAQALNFPSTFGANYYHKWNANSAFSRQSNAYPHISSHTHLYGHHDYNAHPFVPWAWKPLSTTNPTAAKSFAQHCTKGRNHSSRCKPISSTHKQSPGPSQQQSQPIRSHPTTNPNTTIASPQHNATHYQQHSPSATRPSSPAAVSDYDSDSSDSDDESITIPHRCPAASATSKGVTTTNHDTTSKGVSTPILPAYNTRGRAHTITQETILHLLHNTRTPLTPRRAATRQFPREALSAILDTDTGELLEYRHLIKTQSTAPYGKMHMAKNSVASPKVSRHCQRHQHYSLHCVQRNPSAASWGVTYGRIVANYRPRRATLIAFDSQLAVTGSLTLATAAHQQLTCSPPRFSSTASSPQRSTVHDHRHQGFLPQHTNGSP